MAFFGIGAKIEKYDNLHLFLSYHLISTLA